MAKGTADAVRRHIHRMAARHNDSRATDRELLERFAAQRDEAAFEALFRRHAAPVLAAGRRALGNAHDAEDVCQAAFLLLAQKASSQRWQTSVAGWLHRTAHLLALKARTAATRRARREANAAPRSAANPLAEITGQELLTALDEELLALPEPLRAPLLLCYLQGATRDEAAQRLGCSLATLKRQLELGRAQLHAALVRRGLGLSAVLLGTLLAQQTAGAAATIGLARQTARAARAVAAGKSVDGVVSSHVSQMVEGGLGMMCANRFKAALTLLLVGGLIATAGALAVSAGDDRQTGTPPKEAPAPQARNAERPAAAPARAQGTTLRYKFKEGDEFNYVVNKKMETHTTAAGNDRAVVTTRTYDVTWKVVGVDSDGNAKMTLTIDRFRYMEDSGFPGSQVEFDSRKHKNPVGAPAVVRLLSAVLKAQVGAEFTCTKSPRGEVSDFKVPKKVADAVKNTQGLKALYSTESFKQQLACQGSVVLPRDPVSRNGGWKEKIDTGVAGGHARMTVETKATYQGVGQVQAIVTAERIGVQVTPVVGQELLRAVALAVDGEVEHVVRVGGVTQVHPQPRRAQQVGHQLLYLHRRVVGVQRPRLEHAAHHQVVQRPQQVGSRRQPVRQRGAVQEDALPLVDPLQAMQRQVIDARADDQVSQQARPRQPLGDRHRWLGRGDHHGTRVQELARRHRWFWPWTVAHGLGRWRALLRVGIGGCRRRRRNDGGRCGLGFGFGRWQGLGLLARPSVLPGGFRGQRAATRADVLVDEVLDHEQRRWPVLELFALVHADVDAHLTAARTDMCRLR
jgi:RNA polymerase sigma factor (sigma-70 family)